MAYEPESGGLKKAGIILGSLLIAGIAAFLGKGLVSGAINYSQSSHAAVESSLEAGMVGRPNLRKFFTTFKREFPDEYKTLVANVSDGMRSNVPPAEVHAEAFMDMRAIVEKNADKIHRAPRDAIFAVRDGNIEFAKSLATTSPQLCGKFTMDGLGPYDRIPPASADIAMIPANAMLQAVVAGRKAQAPVVEPNDKDWEALVSQMREYGVTENQLQHWGNGTYNSLPVQERCDLGLSVYRALADIDEGVSERIMRLLLSPQAAF